jgi:hypothetical protein
VFGGIDGPWPIPEVVARLAGSYAGVSRALNRAGDARRSTAASAWSIPEPRCHRGGAVDPGTVMLPRRRLTLELRCRRVGSVGLRTVENVIRVTNPRSSNWR